MAYEIHPGSLYDYTAGCYCGVLVKEQVMRKLAVLQAQHMEAVKRLLTDETIEKARAIGRGNVSAGVREAVDKHEGKKQ
jgi:hypothetical protein